MRKRSELQFKVPQPGEVRQSGRALSSTGQGYTVTVESCSNCAAVLGVPWQLDFFEGQCVGCETPLSGFPIEG